MVFLLQVWCGILIEYAICIMARVPGYLTVVEGMSVHKVWRGHNREWNLDGERDKVVYTEGVGEVKR